MYNPADLPPSEQGIYVSFCFVSNFAVDRDRGDFADLTTANPRGPRGSLRRARLMWDVEPSLNWRIAMCGIYIRGHDNNGS